MALSDKVSVAVETSGLSDNVVTTLRNLQFGQTARFPWEPEADTREKLAPLAERHDAFIAVLKAHREKAQINGQSVNLSDKEQTDLMLAAKSVADDMIAIIRAAMNKEATKYRAQSKTLADKLPNTRFDVGTVTAVNPADCRITFTAVRILSTVDNAAAIAAKYLTKMESKPAK